MNKGAAAEILREYAIQADEDHLQVAHDCMESVLRRVTSADMVGSWHQCNGALQRLKILLEERRATPVAPDSRPGTGERTRP